MELYDWAHSVVAGIPQQTVWHINHACYLGVRPEYLSSIYNISLETSQIYVRCFSKSDFGRPLKVSQLECQVDNILWALHLYAQLSPTEWNDIIGAFITLGDQYRLVQQIPHECDRLGFQEHYSNFDKITMQGFKHADYYWINRSILLDRDLERDFPQYTSEMLQDYVKSREHADKTFVPNVHPEYVQTLVTEYRDSVLHVLDRLRARDAPIKVYSMDNYITPKGYYMLLDLLPNVLENLTTGGASDV